MNQYFKIFIMAWIWLFCLSFISMAESQPQAVELLFLVKKREAELAREIDSLKFRVIETKEELNEEGGVEDVKKEIREAVQGSKQNPSNSEMERPKAGE